MDTGDLINVSMELLPFPVCAMVLKVSLFHLCLGQSQVTRIFTASSDHPWRPCQTSHKCGFWRFCGHLGKGWRGYAKECWVEVVGLVVLRGVEGKKWKWENGMFRQLEHGIWLETWIIKRREECRHAGLLSHNAVGTCLLMGNVASSVHAPIV